MTATKLSIAAASRTFDKARNTIAKDVRTGKLSFELGADGSKNVDFSELRRVYGEPPNKGLEAGARKAGDLSHTVGAGGDSDAALRQLQEMHDLLKAERERERKQWEAQVDNLQESLKLAQEGQSLSTKLLEHHSGGGEWKQAIEMMLEKQIVNQQVSKEHLADVAANAKREAFRELQDQSFWRLVWRLIVAKAN